MICYYDTQASPIGRLLLTASDRGLTGVLMQDADGGPQPHSGWIHDPRRLANAATQLRRYFDGELRDFDLPLDLRGTPFQLEVWNALRDIPYAATASYGDIARAISRPNAVRAVGAANGRNPVAIIVPCHRVIGADGSLTGYGGGLPRKQFLLQHESLTVMRVSSTSKSGRRDKPSAGSLPSA